LRLRLQNRYKHTQSIERMREREEVIQSVCASFSSLARFIYIDLFAFWLHFVSVCVRTGNWKGGQQGGQTSIDRAYIYIQYERSYAKGKLYSIIDPIEQIVTNFKQHSFFYSDLIALPFRGIQPEPETRTPNDHDKTVAYKGKGEKPLFSSPSSLLPFILAVDTLIKCLKNERVIYELFVNNVHNRAQKSTLYFYYYYYKGTQTQM